MNYCSLEDILNDIDKDELIKLVDDENRDTLIDLNNENDIAVIRINSIINDATEEINGYLRGKYNLPLNNIPGLLKQICKDITIYKLNKRRFRKDMPESLEKNYDRCIKQLGDISKGFIELEIDENIQDGFFKTNKTVQDKLFGDNIIW